MGKKNQEIYLKVGNSLLYYWDFTVLLIEN